MQVTQQESAYSHIREQLALHGTILCLIVLQSTYVRYLSGPTVHSQPHLLELFKTQILRGQSMLEALLAPRKQSVSAVSVTLPQASATQALP